MRDYLYEEYGDLDCDYVFVTLWSEPRGHPLAYRSVDELVARLRDRTGVNFSPHTFWRTYATELLRRGVAVEVVAKLLGARLDGDHKRYLCPSQGRRRPPGAGQRGVAEQTGHQVITRISADAAALAGPGRADVAERLRAAVRPEFTAELLVPLPGAAVLGTPPCRVPGCARSSSRQSWCQAHYRR